MMTDVLGWLSSAILLMTIGRQVWKQWRTGMGEGVSMWLYIGQLAASTGFTVYSVLLKNWVFIVTNALMMISALAGLYILLVHCRGHGAPAGDETRGNSRGAGHDAGHDAAAGHARGSAAAAG